MIPLERLHAVGPTQSLNDVLPLMARQDVNQLPVVAADGRLLGMVTREAVVHFLEVRRGLGVNEAERRTSVRLPAASTSPVPPAPPHATGASS
jgi:CBS domain-containing protein